MICQRIKAMCKSHISFTHLHIYMIPSGFDTNLHSRFWHLDLTLILKLKTPRRMLRARHRALTFHEHQIPRLFCKGVRGFQAFVPFVDILSFGLFQVRLFSLNYGLLISLMGILHRTCHSWNYFQTKNLRSRLTIRSVW